MGMDLAFLLTGLTSGAEYKDLKEKGIAMKALLVGVTGCKDLDYRDVEFKTKSSSLCKSIYT